MKKFTAALLLFSLLFLCIPVSASPQQAQRGPALSDELNALAGEAQEEAIVPSFYDPDNPLFQGPQMSSGPDTGKLILYGVIGLIILIAAAVMLWGCLGHRKNPPASRHGDSGAGSASGGLCPYCGRPLRPTDRFCPGCGAPRPRR